VCGGAQCQLSPVGKYSFSVDRGPLSPQPRDLRSGQPRAAGGGLHQRSAARLRRLIRLAESRDKTRFTATTVSAIPPRMNGLRSPSAATCATWARISARCRLVSTARKGSSAWGARTRSRNKVRRRSSVACSSATSVRSAPLATAESPRVRSPRGSWRCRGSARRCDGRRNCHPCRRCDRGRSVMTGSCRLASRGCPTACPPLM
jgi:hypothetical protein